MHNDDEIIDRLAFDELGLPKEMRILIADVISDEFWMPKLAAMMSVLNAFDKGAAEEIDIEDPTNKKLQGIVRFCVPLFEIYREIDGIEPDPSWLAAMHLWVQVWRPLDNLLDSNESKTANLREYNISLLRAWTFHASAFPESRLFNEFLACLNDTLDAETNEETRRDPSLIYQRVRLYELIFNDLPTLSEATRETYRRYINSIGIAHDFGDVSNDIKDENTTAVTELFRAIDPHCRVTASHFSALRSKAREVFDTQRRRIDGDALKSCWVTQRNIKAFFTWAFQN